MSRKYYRITPSTEEINSGDIVQHISSLRNFISHEFQSSSITEKLNFLEDDSSDRPVFEFLVLTEGENAPTEFYYSAPPEWGDSLKDLIVAAYPPSFDVDEVDVDLREKLVSPVEYTPDRFLNQLVRDNLQSELPSGSKADIRGDSREDSYHQEDALTIGDAAQTLGTDSTPGLGDSDERTTTVPDDGALEDAAPLAQLEQSLPMEINPPTDISSDGPVHHIDGPTRTSDGNVLARPALDHTTPVAIRWNGKGERRRDWMTPLSLFSKSLDDDSEAHSSASLTMLIQQVSESDVPLAFQVAFQRKPDWTDDAQSRKRDLHKHTDTWKQKAIYHIGDLVHDTSEERRREKRRNYFPSMGENAGGEDSDISGEVAHRKQLIDIKQPRKTFTVNIRAVSLAADDDSLSEVKTRLKHIANSLNHLQGYFYELEPTILTDEEKRFGDGHYATQCLHRLLNKEIVTGSGKKRPELVLNPDELGNFIGVPSAENLTSEGTRGTRAELETENPLPRPHPDIMEELHKPGMRVGYALDENQQPESQPTHVPPELLTYHYGRFASTGAGKTIGDINDLISLYENTQGPNILADLKGNGMAENYMRAHYARFGAQSLKEDVIYFKVPDMIPGFSLFDIRPALERGERRSDAIKKKAMQYIEMMRLVVGQEHFDQSMNAPTLLYVLIHALFDESYVSKKPDRESADYFKHEHLEDAVYELKTALLGGDEENGNIPDIDDTRLRKALTRHKDEDPRDVSKKLSAALNRTDKILMDDHLRAIFDNTTRDFEFIDHFDDDKVILFDLGNLSDEATKLIMGFILSQLWQDVQDADQTSCTMGHDSIGECREYAKQQNGFPEAPPCREEWDDNHMVNLIIDEAAEIASHNVLTQMLEQGRGFDLSVGVSMQFPEQVASNKSRLYRTILNNIHTRIIGKITIDEDIEKAMAHERMSAEEFRNRIRELPRGKWMIDMPTPIFGEVGPKPFSLEPLPIPEGIGPNGFSDQREERFLHLKNNVLYEHIQDQYCTRNGLEDDDSGSELALGTSQGSDTESTTPSAEGQESAANTGNPHSDGPTENGSGESTLSAWRNTDPGVYGKSSPQYEANATSPSDESGPKENGETPPNSHNGDDTTSGSATKTTPTEAPSENPVHRNSHNGSDTATNGAVEMESGDVPGATHSNSHNGSSSAPTAAETGSGGAGTEVRQESHTGGHTPGDGGTSTDEMDSADASGERKPSFNGKNSPSHSWRDEAPEMPVEEQPLRISPDAREASPLSESELRFLATVSGVFNAETDLPRYESLVNIRNHFAVRADHKNERFDVSTLQEEGYLKQHTVDRRVTYTPTKKGRDECGYTLQKGREVGDIGGEMPHRYGADLARDWLLSQHDNIDEVRTFTEIPFSARSQVSAQNSDLAENPVDIIGLEGDVDEYTLQAVVEVEAGMSKAEADRAGPEAIAGINDTKSIQKDHQLLAQVDADAIWVARDIEGAEHILKTVVNSSETRDFDAEVSEKLCREIRRTSIAEFNRNVLTQVDIEGIDAVYTFNQLKRHLN